MIFLYKYRTGNQTCFLSLWTLNIRWFNWLSYPHKMHIKLWSIFHQNFGVFSLKFNVLIKLSRLIWANFWTWCSKQLFLQFSLNMDFRNLIQSPLIIVECFLIKNETWETDILLTIVNSLTNADFQVFFLERFDSIDLKTD